MNIVVAKILNSVTRQALVRYYLNESTLNRIIERINQLQNNNLILWRNLKCRKASVQKEKLNAFSWNFKTMYYVQQHPQTDN